MKRFRVRETYKVSGWTYVKARSKEEAESVLESEDNKRWHFEEDEYEIDTIDWGTLEEMTPIEE